MPTINDLAKVKSKNETPVKNEEPKAVEVPTLNVDGMTELERTLYQHVVSSCIKELASIQGFQVTKNEKWWVSSLREVHALARINVLIMREVNDGVDVF